MLTETCRSAMRLESTGMAILNYIESVLMDGDYLNDYLANVPECGQTLIQAAGQIVALAIGF